MQLDRVRVFRSSMGQSTRMLDVIPQSVTLRKGYVLPYESPTSHTLFHEVEIVPPHERFHGWQGLFQRRCCTVQETSKELCIKVANQLREIVRAKLTHDKFHLVMHSSGYDSRITSLLMKELYDGQDILFACLGTESDSFKKIMAYEEWQRWATLPSYEEHYRAVLDFDRAWRWCNGAMSGPGNLNYVFIDRLQMKGIVPRGDVRIWNGWGTDMALRGAGHPKGNMMRRQTFKAYGATTSLAFFKGDDFVYPFQDKDLLRIVIRSTTRLGYGIRYRLLELLDPGILEFDRGNMPCPPVPEDLLAECVDRYEQSWYGQRVPAIPTPRARHDPWWGHWSSAAFVEHLIKEGYDVRSE